MSSTTSRTKKLGVLEKRIPTNPKYKHVKATVDTGASLSKYMNKIEQIRQNYRFKPNEIFKRMKVTTFVQLMVQVYRITTEDLPSLDDELEDRPDSVDAELQEVSNRDRGDGYSPAPSLAVTEGDFGPGEEPETSRSTLLSVARGIGELDQNRPDPPPPKPSVDNACPYLLLDVRERDDFDQCHIITALSYPKTNMSHVNYESKEMLSYKNQEGKIIVVYDEDERVAPEVGATLVQRGYDNLFLLSGGLKVATMKIPEGLVTGTLPVSLTGSKSKTPPVPATQTKFEEEDINRIEIYLDTALQDNSVGSRLSKASTSSRSTYAKSSMSSRSAASTCGRPAFR